MVSARGRPLISPPHFAFFILSFISAAHGTRYNHQDSDKCHISCIGAGGNSGFEEGYRYKYKFDGSSGFRVGASLADLSPVDLSATVYITPISSCTFHLQLDLVHLTTSHDKISEIGSAKTKESGIIAAINANGKLNGQICAPVDQSLSYTNLHRAVLSLLQSHRPKTFRPEINATVHQTDVFGVCRTDYSIKTNDEDVIVHSTRNLDDCAQREDTKLPLITSPYQTKTEYTKAGVLKGTQTREQKFLNQRLLLAKSLEVYNLASNIDENAATVTVNTKLTFVTQTKATSELSFDNIEKKTLLFETDKVEKDEMNYDDLMFKLQMLSEEPVQSTNPQDFVAFVEKLRRSRKQDIVSVIKDVKSGKHITNKTKAWRVLLDGLVESASSKSIEIISDLLKNGDIEEEKARSWLMSFPNIKTVSEDAILAVKDILEKGIAPLQANLGIGALVGKFCTQHDCKNLDFVDSIEEVMSKILFESCSPTDIITENNMIAGFKGLGNIRYLSDKVAQRLSECALDKKVLLRVRIAILETMKTDSKKKIIQETAETILMDLEDDSEVRIKAYLTLVENPSSEVAEILYKVLSNEQYNQVGGFIASHLKNIKRSNNPDKEAAAHHFSSLYLRAGKFQWDPKKYSHNYLMDYHTDVWGAEAESNMIYSQESYLPRSLSFNLTTYLYGNSYNLFEIGVRTENIEKIYENILTTMVLKRQTVNDVLKNGTELVDHISQSFSRSLGRPKRDIMDKLNEKRENMAKKPKVVHDEFLMDLSVKSLGAEVGFYSHYGDNVSPQKSIDNFFSGIQYSIDKAKNLNVEYSKHSTFLEGEIIYPTGLGLPLKMKTAGSAAFSLSAEANIDVVAYMGDHSSRPHNMKFKLTPSGSVEVIGTMTIDGGRMETGIEVTLSAHSSTGSDTTLKLIKGKEIEIIIGVPMREQNIFSASTGLSTIFRHKYEVTKTPIDPDIDTVSIEDYSGCFEQLSKMTGLTFCGGISLPNNNKPTINPFYGPSKIFLDIHVEDDSITSYLFRANTEQIPESSIYKFNMLLDTPGSKIDRKIFIGYESEMNRELKKAKFMLESIWKSILIEGSLLMTEKEMSITGKLVNDANEYTTKAGLTKSKSSNTVTAYKPFFHYSIPEQEFRLSMKPKQPSPTMKLSGEVLVERKEAEGITTYYFNQVTLETHRYNSNSNYTIDGSISSQFKGESSTFNSNLNLIIDEAYVTINATISRPNKNILEGNIIVLPLNNPMLAFSSRGKLECVADQDFKFSSEFDYTHGPDPDNKDMRFTFNNHVLISGIKEKNVKYIAIKHYVRYPPMNLLFESDLEWLPRNLKYNLGANFDQSCADLKITASTDPAGPYDIFIAAKIMDQGFKLDMKREVIESYKSKFSNTLELTPSRLFQVNALVSHKFFWSDLDLSLQSEVKTPLLPQHIRLSTGIQNNKEKILGQFFLEADTKVFIDLFFERIKGSQSKGNFKFFLSDYIDSKGDFGFQDSVLKGSGFIIFLKSKNKVDAAIDLIINYPKYAGSIGLNWKRSQDSTKSLRIDTDTDFDHGVFDTKNKFVYDGKESLFNFKFIRSGNSKKGTINADMEVKIAELDHIMVKFSRNLNGVPGDSEGEYNLETSHKATATSNPTELVIRLVGKHIDFEQGKIDGQLAVTYASTEGKDVVIQLAHKKVPKDDKWNINCMFDVSGSLVESPLTLIIETETSRSNIDSVSWIKYLPPSSYKIFGSFGKNTNLESFGKITGNTFSGEFTLKLPQTYKLTFMKWTTINLVQFHPGPDNKRQVKSSNVFKWNQEFFEIDSEFILEKEEAKVKFDWETDETKKRTLQFQSHWHPLKMDGSADIDISFKYDKDGKPSDAYMKYSCNVLNGEVSFHFHATCPATGVYDLKIASKRFKDGKGKHAEWILQANNKTMKGLCKIISDADHPHIEYYIEDENNTKSGFLIKADKKGLSEWTGNVHVEWAIEPGKKGFFYVNSAMKLVSIDNFLIKIDANSNKYQLEDWQVEIYSDPTAIQQSGMKNVNFKMTHDSQIILNGTALYDLNYVKDGIYKIEAEGKAMLNEHLKPLSLKAIFKPSTYEKLFNGSLSYGESTITVESSYTNGQMYYSRKYCNPTITNKCSESRLIWTSLKLGPEQQENKLEVFFDSNYFNMKTNDIILRASCKRDGSLVDHKVEIQWIKNKPFIYKAYILHDKAGLTIVLPQRTISGDIAFIFPKDINQGRLFVEGNLWLNKYKEPNKKAYLLISGEVSRDKEFYELITDSKFSHPALSKDIAIKGKATSGKSWVKPTTEGHFEFDMFKKSEDALLLTWNLKNMISQNNIPVSVNLKSKGLKIDMGYELKVAKLKESVSESNSVYYIDQTGIKRESSLTVLKHPSRLSVSVKLPDVSMYEFSYAIEESNEKKINLYGNYEIAGAKYKETINIHFPNISYQFNFGKGKTFSVNFGLMFNKAAEIKTNFNKKTFFQIELSLTEKDFLRVKHYYDNDVYRKLFETIADEATMVISNIDKEVKRAVDRDGKALALLVTKLGNAVTDVSPLYISYQQDLQSMLLEIIEDEEIMSSLSPLRETLSAAVEQGVEIVEEFITLTSHFRKAVEEATDYAESIILALTNKIKETSKSISMAIKTVINSSFDAYLRFNDRIFTEFDKYKTEIQTINTVISDFSQEMGSHIYKFMKLAKKEYDDFILQSWETIKEMPLFQILEEKFQELKNYKFSEGFWPDIKEILIYLEDSAPNPELKKFINTLTNYIDQYLKEEKMDLDAVTRQILAEFIASIRPTLNSIHEAIYHDTGVFSSQFWLPLPGTSLWKAAKYSKYIKYGNFNWLISEDIPPVFEYTLQSWTSIQKLLPPYKGRAYISGGEIVTFDGQSVSLENGVYVLAQELNGKFVIIARVKDDKMISVEIIQNGVRMKHTVDGKLWMNDRVLEHTTYNGVDKPHARYSLSGGNLNTEQVSVVCRWNIKVCSVILKPSAFAKVWGALGTYNYESYDDLTLPNGKISTNKTEFVKSWNIQENNKEKSRQIVETKSPDLLSMCTDSLTNYYGFRLCYWLVNPKPYIEMCQHLVGKATTSEERRKAMCLSIYHFTKECRANNIKISIPPPCDVCEVDGQIVTTDEFKLMKTPSQTADIVFLVDLNKNNSEIYENLIRPLTDVLEKKLKSKGITDVEYGLIGFGSLNLTNINYFKINGKLQMKKYLPSKLPWDDGSTPKFVNTLHPNCTLRYKMDSLWRTVDKYFIADDQTERGIVRKEISQAYPWRPGSVRSIVALVSSPCPLPEPILSPLTRIKTAQKLMTMKSYGIIYNLITPVKNLKLSSGRSSEVVGFTKDKTYLSKDFESGKSAKDRKEELTYTPDTCHQFALETGGNVFVSDNLKGGNSLEAVSTLLTTSLVSQEQIFSCQCNIIRGVHPKYECSVQR